MFWSLQSLVHFREPEKSVSHKMRMVKETKLHSINTVKTRFSEKLIDQTSAGKLVSGLINKTKTDDRFIAVR